MDILSAWMSVYHVCAVPHGGQKGALNPPYTMWVLESNPVLWKSSKWASLQRCIFFKEVTVSFYFNHKKEYFCNSQCDRS